MTNERIKEIALANGHALFTMPDGTEDIHPHVYDFARALQAKFIQSEIESHQGYLNECVGSNESTDDYARDSILDLQEKLAESNEVNDD